MLSTDNKEYLTDALRVEDILRLIQSIPSPNAEPFKRWLAKVGYERLQEYQNPELIIKRAVLQYQAKGYDEDWIKIRVNNIIGRKELEGEWFRRGIQNGLELLFTSLAEQSTSRIARSRNAHGFYQNKKAAESGGRIAGDARRNLEKELGEPVVSPDNYLTEKQRQNQKKLSPSAQKRLQDILKPQS